MDKTSALFSYYNFPLDKLVIIDELLLDKDALTSEDLINLLKDREKINGFLPPDSVRLPIQWADSGNPILLSDWASKYGMAFSYPKKSSVRAMVNEARVWLKNKRVLIDPKCVMLIRTLKHQLWQTDSKGTRLDEFARTEELGHGDLAAAFVYTITLASAYRSVNPIPETFGRDLSNTHFAKKNDPSFDPFFTQGLPGFTGGSL